MEAIRIEWGAVAAVYGVLLSFGILYALFVRRFDAELDGHTGVLVAVGVFVTLVGAALIHHPAGLVDFLLTLGAFAASGVPMLVGDWLGDAEQRRGHIDRVQQLVDQVVAGREPVPAGEPGHDEA